MERWNLPKRRRKQNSLLREKKRMETLTHETRKKGRLSAQKIVNLKNKYFFFQIWCCYLWVMCLFMWWVYCLTSSSFRKKNHILLWRDPTDSYSSCLGTLRLRWPQLEHWAATSRTYLSTTGEKSFFVFFQHFSVLLNYILLWKLSDINCHTL